MEKSIDKSSVDSGTSNSAKFTAADFEEYAPKALALADLYGEGLATRAEITHLVESPLSNEDVKTQAAMKILAENYDFMTQLSHPVDVVYGKTSTMLPIPSYREAQVTKYGITPDAIDKLNLVLEGKKDFTVEDVNGSRKRDGMFGAVGLGVPLSYLAMTTANGAVAEAAGGTVLWGAGMLAAGTGGLLLGAAVGGYIVYELAKQNIDQKNFDTHIKVDYSKFLFDLDETPDSISNRRHSRAAGASTSIDYSQL